MKKLKLKYLASYLPYGLKIKSDKNKQIRTMAISINNSDDVKNKILISTIIDCKEYKPILRPLSELTKDEIKLFTVDVRLILKRDIYSEQNLLSVISFIEFQWLVERHFDVFGLIQKGLAIDINTLKL